MISMVDSDGDGQVSFEEFHRLVIDPDPSRADFSIEPIKTDVQEAAQVTQASAAEDKQQQMQCTDLFVVEDGERPFEDVAHLFALCQPVN